MTVKPTTTPTVAAPTTYEKIQEEGTAYHEAGHAVLAYFFCSRIDLVTIVGDGKSRGRVVSQLPETMPDLERYDADYVISAAGRLAHARHGAPHPKDPRYGAAGDKQNERRQRRERRQEYDSYPPVARWLNSGAIATDRMERSYYRYLDRVAENYVELLWPAIESVARQLLDRKTIQGDEAHEIIRDGLWRAAVESSAGVDGYVKAMRRKYEQRGQPQEVNR